VRERYSKRRAGKDKSRDEVEDREYVIVWRVRRGERVDSRREGNKGE
jgi:hypothetical protein